MASFVYDGDGQRVKATVAGVTTTYLGNHYELTASPTTAVCSCICLRLLEA